MWRLWYRICSILVFLNFFISARVASICWRRMVVIISCTACGSPIEVHPAYVYRVQIIRHSRYDMVHCDRCTNSDICNLSGRIDRIQPMTEAKCMWGGTCCQYKADGIHVTSFGDPILLCRAHLQATENLPPLDYRQLDD